MLGVGIGFSWLCFYCLYIPPLEEEVDLTQLKTEEFFSCVLWLLSAMF
jgi:hypothetical protein